MTEPKSLPREIYSELLKPISEKAIKQHPTKSYLSTIKAMYIVERLNNVFGAGRWTLEHSVVHYENDYVLMKGNLVLLDYPDCIIPMQYGGHPTAGKNTEIADGFKSAVTDILSKTASYIGIGIDVFKGEQSHKNSYNKPTKNNKPDITTKPLRPEVANHNTTKNDQITYISEKIMEMSNNNIDDASGMLELLSQFKTKEGELIPGFKSFKTLVQRASEKRVTVIYATVKKEYENYLKNGIQDDIKKENNIAKEFNDFANN